METPTSFPTSSLCFCLVQLLTDFALEVVDDVVVHDYHTIFYYFSMVVADFHLLLQIIYFCHNLI